MAIISVRFDRYENTVVVYVVYKDGSKKDVAKFYMMENFIHMDVTAENFRFVPYIMQAIDITNNTSFCGVTLENLYKYLIGKMSEMDFSGLEVLL